jgi:hypothetical protein
MIYLCKEKVAAAHASDTESSLLKSRLKKKTASLKFDLAGVIASTGQDVNHFLVVPSVTECNDSIYQREDGVVTADSGIAARFDYRASLADNDCPCSYSRTSCSFYAEIFRITVATVLGRSAAFFMSHI